MAYVAEKGIDLPPRLAHLRPRHKSRVEPAMAAFMESGLPARLLKHVEDGNDVPAVHCPDVPGWTWNRLTTTGDPVDRILEVAADIAADLIVMATDGPDGFLDALRGTTSARVLNKARCPVASLPVGARLAT